MVIKQGLRISRPNSLEFEIYLVGLIVNDIFLGYKYFLPQFLIENPHVGPIVNGNWLTVKVFWFVFFFIKFLQITWVGLIVNCNYLMAKNFQYFSHKLLEVPGVGPIVNRRWLGVKVF